jgi:hypothetical protein
MPDENDGVLGNLPRSRPGQRSSKRAERPGASAAKAAADAERAGADAAEPASEEPPRRAPEPPPGRGGDPVGDAVRAAAKVAETTVRVGLGVTREILRRLPRP